jgi:hypothetical protein
MFGISHAMINYTLYDFLKNRYSNDISRNPELIIMFSFISKCIILIFTVSINYLNDF